MARARSLNGLSGRSEAFELAFKLTWIFGVFNTMLLASVILVAFKGGSPSTFMWIRASVLTLASPFLLWLVRRASAGSDAAGGRIRIVSTVLPIAVIVIDFFPGVAPIWYAAMQGLGALALIPVALISHRWADGSVDA